MTSGKSPAGYTTITVKKSPGRHFVKTATGSPMKIAKPSSQRRLNKEGAGGSGLGKGARRMRCLL